MAFEYFTVETVAEWEGGPFFGLDGADGDGLVLGEYFYGEVGVGGEVD